MEEGPIPPPSSIELTSRVERRCTGMGRILFAVDVSPMREFVGDDLDMPRGGLLVSDAARRAIMRVANTGGASAAFGAIRRDLERPSDGKTSNNAPEDRFAFSKGGRETILP